ncbi:MAG: hypothetical protein JNK72_07035 [Myxococcales bacterium]|nr:hypothetical protein [Myxococcales bacterium]
MNRRLSRLIVCAVLGLGCVFGSRPILPTGAGDQDGGGIVGGGGADAAAFDSGAVAPSLDAGVSNFADGGRGGEDAAESQNDSLACVPVDAGDAGGDAGFAFRDGGGACDPARDNPHDAGADAAADARSDGAADAPDGRAR